MFKLKFKKKVILLKIPLVLKIAVKPKENTIFVDNPDSSKRSVLENIQVKRLEHQDLF